MISIRLLKSPDLNNKKHKLVRSFKTTPAQAFEELIKHGFDIGNHVIEYSKTKIYSRTEVHPAPIDTIEFDGPEDEMRPLVNAVAAYQSMS